MHTLHTLLLAAMGGMHHAHAYPAMIYHMPHHRTRTSYGPGTLCSYSILIRHLGAEGRRRVVGHSKACSDANDVLRAGAPPASGQ